jgi:hypothetical protein
MARFSLMACLLLTCFDLQALCSFSGTTGGLLKANTFIGFIYSNNPARTIITTDAADTYEVILSPVTDFATAPTGVYMPVPAVMSGSLSGANNGSLSGSPSGGYSAELPNIGDSTLSVSVVDAEENFLAAGSYVINSTVTCIAQ